MTESIFLGALLGGALVLFYTQWLRPDVTALLVMLALMVPWRPGPEGTLLGVLSVEQAFSGFGSPALMMVAAMFVISAAMTHTGAAAMLGQRVLRAGAGSEWRFQLTVFGVVTLFSAFINDTTTVVMWMPMVLAVCRERGYSPARLLLPLAYASLLGGQWTLIGTRSNILVSDYLRLRAGSGLGFFSFSPIAAAVFATVLGFFALWGRRLLPRGGDVVSLAERYEVAEYMTEVLAVPGSEVIGKSLGELDLFGRFGVRVLGVVRGEQHLRPSLWLRLAPEDVLVVQARISQITKLLEQGGLQVREELVVGEQTLRSVELVMAEAVVGPGSHYEGRTLEELGFAGSDGGISVLAIGRHGRPVRGRISRQVLRAGDSLLLVGHHDGLAELRLQPGIFLLESRALEPIGTRRAWRTLAILVVAVVASATRLAHPGFAIPAGAMACVLLRCISMRQAYESLHLDTLVVLGGLIPLGLALETTGTAHRLGDLVHAALAPLGLVVVFAALLAVAVALTQLIENAAVAVILAPLAYELAVSSGGDPRTFLLGLAICISSAFMSPVAHESTILVMGPGRYRFADYLRLGTPLAVLTWLVTVLVVPLLHPLAAS